MIVETSRVTFKRWEDAADMLRRAGMPTVGVSTKWWLHKEEGCWSVERIWSRNWWERP